jgi:hypothetical protein
LHKQKEHIKLRNVENNLWDTNIASRFALGIVEIAGKMKQDGMPVDTIMLYTGLTQEQVEAL